MICGGVLEAFLSSMASQKSAATKMRSNARFHGEGVGWLKRGSALSAAVKLRVCVRASSSSTSCIGTRSYFVLDMTSGKEVKWRSLKLF